MHTCVRACAHVHTHTHTHTHTYTHTHTHTHTQYHGRNGIFIRMYINAILWHLSFSNSNDLNLLFVRIQL